jgi:hypothetical protein
VSKSRKVHYPREGGGVGSEQGGLKAAPIAVYGSCVGLPTSVSLPCKAAVGGWQLSLTWGTVLYGRVERSRLQDCKGGGPHSATWFLPLVNDLLRLGTSLLEA